jgi:hypothetical protein
MLQVGATGKEEEEEEEDIIRVRNHISRYTQYWAGYYSVPQSSLCEDPENSFRG